MCHMCHLSYFEEVFKRVKQQLLEAAFDDERCVCQHWRMWREGSTWRTAHTALARASSKRANIHNRWLSSRRLRSLRSPMMMVESSLKRANIWGMFTICCENPQVTFASLSSPAVMDIRSLRGRSSLAEVLTTIEIIWTIFSLFG